MKSKVRLVIFDLDGTLINAYPAVERSINYVLKKAGCDPVDTETIKRTVGWGDRHLVETFTGPEKINKAIVLYRRHHKKALEKDTTLLPGAKRLLQILKKNGYKLAIASNRPAVYTNIVLEYLDIKKYFDRVLCGDKSARPKPHPDIILELLEKFGLKKSESLYVGDMTIDMQTGKRAGVKTVIVTTGSSTREDILKLKPFKVISNVYEVNDVLEKINGV